MPSAPRPAIQPPAAGGFLSRLLMPLGSPCRVCGRWQHAVICADCIRLLAPAVPRCPRCAIAVPSGHTPGEPCRLCEDYPPTFDQAVAALDYVTPWTTLIGRLKFDEEPALAEVLGSLLAQRVAMTPRWQHPADRPIVLSAPLSARRLRERGYNQAALVSRVVARSLQLASLPNALARIRHTERLMKLSPDDRRLAIRGAYAVSEAAVPLLRGRHVAVVDDVMTTGATLDEITLTLQEAGVRSVAVWVVARTPAPDRSQIVARSLSRSSRPLAR